MISTEALIALVKIAATFAVMLFAIRRTALWIAILLGGVILSLLFGLSPLAIGGVCARAFRQPGFYTLFLAVFCIMSLSEVQSATGQGRRLVSGLTPYMRSTRLRLAFFPALVGLLPMPGGAVFSCPMIRDVSDSLDMNAPHKVLVNYWFRHIWESAWPLYPGYILTCSLAEIPPSLLWRYTFPLVLFSSFTGWLFLLKKPIRTQDGAEIFHGEKRPLPSVLLEALPIAVAIGGALVLDLFTPALGISLPAGGSFVFSFAAAAVTAMIQNKMSPPALFKLVFRPHVGKMLALIAAIFVFKELVSAANVVDVLQTAFSGRAAILTLFFFLPVIMGLLTGIMLGFVGAAFPLLLALLAQTGTYDERLIYVLVGLTAGHFGQMISPMHSCYLVTLEFFKVPLSHTWYTILKTSAFALVLAVIYLAALYVTINPVL